MKNLEHDSTKTIWEGKAWRLRLTSRMLADGSEVQSAYIDHPGAVVLVPLRSGSNGTEILMLEQYRHSVRQVILELPAGTRGWDEDWQACAQRELREETGFRAGRLHELSKSWPAPGVSNELMTIYLAQDLQPDPLTQDADEEILVVPYPFAELIAMALNGRLQDAKSVVGILQAAAYFKLPPFSETAR